MQWVIVATGEYNGDAQTDIVWRHLGSGQIALWFMEGTTLLGGTLTTPPALTDIDWAIVAPR